MPPDSTAVLEAQLVNLDRKLDAVHTSLKGDISEIKTELGEVKREAKRTNGRLRSLEEWRAMARGALVALGLAKPIVYTTVGIALGVVVERIFGG